MNIIFTNLSNTISKIVSIHSECKKVGYKIDYNHLHTVLLVIVLLLIITIIFYDYAKHRIKLKKSYSRANKCRMMNFKEFILKIVRVIVDTTKFEDFDSDNFFIIEKLHENILIYDISFKTTIGTKPLHIIFNQIKG